MTIAPHSGLLWICWHIKVILIAFVSCLVTVYLCCRATKCNKVETFGVYISLMQSWEGDLLMMKMWNVIWKMLRDSRLHRGCSYDTNKYHFLAVFGPFLFSFCLKNWSAVSNNWAWPPNQQDNCFVRPNLTWGQTKSRRPHPHLHRYVILFTFRETQTDIGTASME